MTLLRCLLSVLLLGAMVSARAEETSHIPHEVESNWSGIYYQITFFKRIPNDRLLVGISVVASAKAPLAGTLIGIPVPIPVNARPFDVAAGYYHPLPFSLASSSMVDDLSQQKYPALAPIVKYRQSELLAILKPGQGHLLTLQFTIPPPPPPPAVGQAPIKQTVSFYLSNAKGPISNIALPVSGMAPPSSGTPPP